MWNEMSFDRMSFLPIVAAASPESTFWHFFHSYFFAEIYRRPDSGSTEKREPRKSEPRNFVSVPKPKNLWSETIAAEKKIRYETDSKASLAEEKRVSLDVNVHHGGPGQDRVVRHLARTPRWW